MALPNVLLYPVVLAGLFWVFSPPLVSLVGAIYLWRHRREETATLTIWLTVLTLGLYVGHVYQSERFVAAPATLLTIFAAVAIAQWAGRRSQISAPETRELHPTQDRSEHQ